MKTLKVKSILFSLLAMMAIAVLMISCSKENVVIPNPVEQVLTEDNEQGNEKRGPLMPCYPTGGAVIPTIQTEEFCNMYWGFVWSNGQCWAKLIFHKM